MHPTKIMPTVCNRIRSDKKIQSIRNAANIAFREATETITPAAGRQTNPVPNINCCRVKSNRILIIYAYTQLYEKQVAFSMNYILQKLQLYMNMRILSGVRFRNQAVVA